MSTYGREPRHGYPRFTPADQVPAYERGQARTRIPYMEPDQSGYLPRIDETDPRQPIGPPLRAPEPSYQDMIVPRVFLEPDPTLDDLRIRAHRLAIIRDIFLIIFLIVATFYVVALIAAGRA